MKIWLEVQPLSPPQQKGRGAHYRKVLKGYPLNYEVLQTVTLNNRPLTHCYHEELEDCLTTNHMLFGKLKLFDSDQGSNETIPSKKQHNIKYYFGMGGERNIQYLR